MPFTFAKKVGEKKAPVVTVINSALAIQAEPKNTEDIPTNLKRKLKGLGIAIERIGEPILGPVVTTFPIIPSMSTPIAKITKRAEDLALACGVDSVDVRRIGREVHVFVPNAERKIVNFMDALHWYLKDEDVRRAELPLLLGMDFTGKNSFIDLTKQPHILISGSTGSGKSILETNIIASLAMLKSPRELELYLVDNKTVDLPLLKRLPHVKRVATSVNDFYRMITKLQGLVEDRLEILSDAGVRNIQEYNNQHPDTKLSYALMIVDEFAYLLDADKDERSANGKEHSEPKVLDSVRKLLQVSRAAGVHVIICTQRTSGDVISGIAKVNLPTRIALRLPTKKDSEYILDEGGAENLLGNGDMLLKSSDSDVPKRYHSPFVDLKDIERVIEQIDGIKLGYGLEA